ncbi:MAG: hypothetical protein AAGA42_15345 [Actinomycetota bacterium]
MSSVWDDVVGQSAAITQLERAAENGPVHAYLFVGPAGSTKLEAARGFAARLLSGGEDAAQRDARLAIAGTHPDVREVRRTGAAISADQARDIVHVASLAPAEGDRKVLILDEFHLLRPEGAALMLKTIEEPPASTMFIVLADFVPHDLVTIASRCARIDFVGIPEHVVAARLVAEGVAPAAASAAARGALGDLDRARVLANDPDLSARRTAFAAAPHELDGTGAVAMRTARQLLDMIDDAAAPMTARHAAEIDAFEEQTQQLGRAAGGRKPLDDRHRRELRRHRTDELRAGLAAMAATYRDTATNGGTTDVDGCAAAISRIGGAIEALERNPNERLLLEALLWSLPDAQGV